MSWFPCPTPCQQSSMCKNRIENERKDKHIYFFLRFGAYVLLRMTIRAAKMHFLCVLLVTDLHINLSGTSVGAQNWGGKGFSIP
jgi:hypothetical protein